MEQDATGKLYEFVVFGATGFTGRFVVEELAHVLEGETSTVFRWAVAGRNREKLAKLVSTLSQKLGKHEASIGTIVCDVNDSVSLGNMCKQTSLLMNCVGPYWLLGEPVVKACIENGTNYIDICGEPKFLEEMYMKYNNEAAENGVHVVGSSGFSSIPADMGVIFTQNKVKGTITTIESFWHPKLTKGFEINCTAWQAAIHGLQFQHRLKRLRKQMSLEPIPFIDKTVKRNVHYCRKYNYVAIPYIGADASVVRRTQRYLYEHHQKTPVHYVSYSVVSGFVSALLLLFAGFLLTLLAKIKCGRNFLLKHCTKRSLDTAFSDEGPTQRRIKETSFQMQFISTGYSPDKDPIYDKPNMVAYTSIEGPEPAYVTTSIAMVQAAVTMIKEPKLLPKGGGVFTPGAAFAQTSLLNRLSKSGLKFSVEETRCKDQ